MSAMPNGRIPQAWFYPCLLCLAVLFLVWSSVTRADNPASSDAAARLLEESSNIERLLKEVEEKERKATQALQQAEQALRLSREEKDDAAELIATEARNISQQALDKARSKKLAYQKRSLEIDALLGRGADSLAAVLALDMKGDVYVKTKLGYVKIGPDFKFRKGEEIRTGSTGELMLQVDENGSKIHLGPDSAFAFAEMSNEGAGFDLSAGKLRATIVRLGTRRFAVRTTGASVGVRGTEFEVLATAEATETRVYSGQVEVTPLKGQGSVLVGAGQKAIVGKNGNVIGPHPLNTSERDDTVAFIAKK